MLSCVSPAAGRDSSVLSGSSAPVTGDSRASGGASIAGILEVREAMMLIIAARIMAPHKLGSQDRGDGAH
jgi:tetrahydrodipicolinate N-succinyltransferase